MSGVNRAFGIVGLESSLDFGEACEFDLGAAGAGGYTSNGVENDMRLTDSSGSESVSSGIGMAVARRRFSSSPFIGGKMVDSRAGTGTAVRLREIPRRDVGEG